MTKRISNRLLAVLLLLAAVPVAAQAQQSRVRALEVGDTVRVITPDQGEGPFTGVLTAYEWQGLTVRQRGTGVERTIPFADVRGLARSLGVRREHTAWRGARMGAFSLGAAGLVSGPLIATSQSGDRWELAGTTALTAASGLVLGGAIGGALGWALAREEWQEFQTPAAAHVSVYPGGATIVGVSLRTR
ncbi:MAG: hypothetical protein KY467_13230 [Gemmatimonadetes bacterium]|nr:hypothetical protein [Gemmatimonadota bacterium]